MTIEEINQKRTVKQLEIVDKWISLKARGYVEAATGFGKSFVGKFAIEECLKRNPLRRVHIVVPSKLAYEVWEKLKLESSWGDNVEVFIINTYMNARRHCDLLVADEVHRYSNEESLLFSELLVNTLSKFCLCLSATLTDTHKAFLESNNIPFVDRVTLEEAEREQYVASFDLYCIKIPLSMKQIAELSEINESFDKAYSHFDQLGVDRSKTLTTVIKVLKDKVLEKSINQANGWSSNTCLGLARKTLSIIKKREAFFKKAESKIVVAKRVIEILKEHRIITFSQHTEVADKIAADLHDAVAYHGSLKTKYFVQSQSKYVPEDVAKTMLPKTVKKIGLTKLLASAKHSFESGEKRVLCCAKKVDEAANINNVNTALIVSFSSSDLQLVQRIGRVIRAEEGKRATVIILYLGSVKKTQEQRWLEDALAKTKEPIWLDDIKAFEALMKEKCILTQVKQ